MATKIEVTRQEFFDSLYRRPEDIMPRIVGKFPYTSEWRNQQTNRLFGETCQTVLNGTIQTSYWLAS